MYRAMPVNSIAFTERLQCVEKSSIAIGLTLEKYLHDYKYAPNSIIVCINYNYQVYWYTMHNQACVYTQLSVRSCPHVQFQYIYIHPTELLSIKQMEVDMGEPLNNRHKGNSYIGLVKLCLKFPLLFYSFIPKFVTYYSFDMYVIEWTDYIVICMCVIASGGVHL